MIHKKQARQIDGPREWDTEHPRSCNTRTELSTPKPERHRPDGPGVREADIFDMILAALGRCIRSGRMTAAEFFARTLSRHWPDGRPVHIVSEEATR